MLRSCHGFQPCGRSPSFFSSLFTTVAAAQSSQVDLPDIGSSAEAALPKSDEYRIGLMIVRQLRDQGQILDDPEVNEYVQSVGARLAAQVGEDGQNFQFFVVKDPRINAFALPGGFIGVNLGLILATSNESQLASVLGHEMAHVVQRHIARSIEAQGRQSLASAAAMLAAILIGAAAGGGGNAMQAGIAVAQGTAIQQQINFTRQNEYEADRVGISFLAGAGFDPRAMADFFETVGRRSGLSENADPRVLPDSPGFLEPHRRGSRARRAVSPPAPPRRFGELCPRPRAPAGARHRCPRTTRGRITRVVSSTVRSAPASVTARRSR